jgi:hypothetical protein
MAAVYTDAERNYLADQEAARITHMSLHTANPGTSGTGEATGGSPAYARQAVTFNAAGAVGPMGGTAQPATVGVAWSNQVTFDLAAGTYTHFGAWSAVTAGTLRCSNALSSSQVLASQGQVKVSIGVGPVSAA